jgi:hypothetical protein
MRKSAPAMGFALLFVCFSLVAQRTTADNSLEALNTSQPQLSALSLANAQPFSFPKTLGWVDAASSEFLPPLPAAGAQKTTEAATRLPDSSKEAVDLPKRNLLDYTHGEIGVLYGHSIGKFDRDVEAGYILGQVGDDKLQIGVGASYERWSGRFPRFSR